jgi:hypothetical protein
MEKVFFTALGAILLLFVARDVHVTILHSGGRNGLLSRFVVRSIWQVVHAGTFHHRSRSI